MPLQRSKATRHRAAFTLVAAAAVVGACGHKTDVLTRKVTTHVPAQCAPDLSRTSPYGLFVASGDFDPSVGVGHSLVDVGAELAGVPSSTRAIVVDVSAGDLEWRGVRDVPASGDVDVLLWPFTAPCALSGQVDPATGATLGAIDATRALVVGGAADPLPRAWVADLTTGALTSMQDGLLTPRARATVTSFGAGALVAGGVSAVDGTTALGTAEVFVAGLHGVGDFDRQTIPLSGPRADHGAVALSTGETLLVGGRGATGAPLRSLEIVDPAGRGSRTQGLAQLEVARTAPIVLRLANGEILVAGGFDDQNHPVTKLEWLTPDARRAARQSRDLVARKQRGFVALPGGGALAVIAPDPTDVAFPSVWVISADGDPEPATPIVGALASVALFPGSGGRPVLWTGDRWLQWSPWQGAFVALDVLPPALAGLPLGPTGDAITSPEPGLALFLTLNDARVTGVRFASQSAYAALLAPLLAGDTTLVAPDRLVLPGTTTSMAYDPQQGLELTPGATAFVTDLTFAGVALDFDAPTGELPLVVLRDPSGTETELGATRCAVARTPGAAQTIHLERTGASVKMGGIDCGGFVPADARVGIGFRGPPGFDRGLLQNVRIMRH